jgi:hypothetical protein
VTASLALAALAAGADEPSVLTLKFSDFHKQPVGPRGLELGEPLRAAHGRTVRIVGYMVASEQAQPGRFQLTARPVRLSEHADGDADDLPPATVLVLLDPSQADQVVPQRHGLIALTGTLHVGRREEADGRVSWVRLQMPTDATRRAFSRPIDASHRVAHTH